MSAYNLKRYSDVALAIFVVAVAGMLLVPLPTALLDILLVINISFSLLLLLVGLYVPNPLTLFTFPSLLLLSTLFRLSLNVASTRLILTQGDAGRVIDAFGRFLVRGDVAVGMIIFTIVTVVNFIVIAKGSSRVSEVAARFALDALPGRQMAIDADLRTGLITAIEAQTRREHLRRESQLYGAMDGAMKFVQGDAIAGFFIILTNIIGGIFLGVSMGMSLPEAVQTYTILTVGDGLVTQIPALFISICAGIVVTRVASSDDTTLSKEVSQQLFSRPATVLLAGLMLAGLGLLPGMPWIPFTLVGALFVAASYWISKRQLQVAGDQELVFTRLESSAPLALPSTPPSVPGAQHFDKGDAPLEIAFDAAVLYRLYRANAQRYSQWWQEFQHSFLNEVGIHLPDVRIESDERLAAGHFRLSCSSTTIEEAVVPLDAILLEVNPAEVDVFGCELVAQIEHPLTGNYVSWVRDTNLARKIVDAAELRSFDFLGVAALRLAAFVQNFPEEVFTLANVHTELKELERRYPGLLEDSLDRRFINLSRLTEIVQELIRQRINVRDLRQIIDNIAAYCSAYAKSGLEPGDFDLQEIVSFIRVMRKRQILSRISSERNTLRVLRVAEDVEELLSSSSVAVPSGYPELKLEQFESMRSSFLTLIEPLGGRGLLPVVVLGSVEIREKLRALLRTIHRGVTVLGEDEIEPFMTLEPVGIWHMS